MKEMVKKKAKTVLLLALCAALAASACPSAAVRAAAVSEQPGSGSEADVPGSGDTEEKPDGSSTEQNPGDDGTQGDTGSSGTEQNPDGGSTEEKPGGSDTEEKPDDGGAEENPGGSTEEKPGGDDADKKPEKVTVTASVRLTRSKNAAYIRWKRVDGAYAYKIQRSSKKDSGFHNIASLSRDDRSYKDTGVKKGSRYYYRVAAKLADGRTCFSKAYLLTCPLGAVSGVKLIRYSTSSIKVTWNRSKDKNANLYKVYYAKDKLGKYKLAGTTRDNWYRVKNLANYQQYYFRVEACVSKKSSALDSDPSKAVSMTTKPYERLTIFAGDSITTGLTSYGTVNKINIGGKKKVIAAIGLNTITFRTKRVFNGLSATQAIVANKPYRVYIMLGNNDIHYRDKKDVIEGYREILKTIRSGSPETDIVVLAVAPVTAATKERRTGFKQIPAYNKDLKALAEKMGVKFYDCTAFMKDSGGWLKSSYAAGDGIHWKSPVYDQYAKLLESYDKSLD